MEDYGSLSYDALSSKYIYLKKTIQQDIKRAQDELFFGNFLFSGFFVNDNLKKAGILIEKLEYMLPELQSCCFTITQHIKVDGVPSDIIVIIFSFVDPIFDFVEPVSKLTEEHLENIEYLKLSGNRRVLIRYL